MRHVWICLLLLVLASGLVVVLARALRQENKSLHPLLGKPAPPLLVNWLQGGEEFGETTALSLQQLQRRTIVNFWASWCLGCRQEAPLLEGLWQKQKLLVIGLAVHDSRQKAERFAKLYGKSYPLALDIEGRTGIEYGVTGVPESFIIDKQGIVREHWTGKIDVEFLTIATSLSLPMTNADDSSITN